MKIDRLISIIMILLERQKISVAELAEICEVTPRTLSRDLDTINQAGIPIVSYMGASGGVGIMENFKLEKRLFTVADVVTLLMGLSSIHTSMTGNEVVDALAKIKGIIPEELREEIELRAARVSIDMTPWVGNSAQTDRVKMIQQAMERQAIINFDYTDRMGNKSQRNVEPYRLVLKEMMWYLEAYCLTRKDFRIFKLSRMDGLNISDAAFAARVGNLLNTAQPEFRDENMVRVTLNVRGSALEKLSDLFEIKTSQDVYDEWTSLQIPLTNDERGYKFLLGLGADCVCIEPETVRRGIKHYIYELARMYNNHNTRA